MPEMTNLVLAQYPGRTILVCPIDSPYYTTSFITLVVTTPDGARLQTSKDSIFDSQFSIFEMTSTRP
jgi:molybdopterin-guanine dinucleotide biosynthesis protein A